MSEILDYHGHPGEHVSQSAQNCIQLSEARGCPVRLNFNDIELEVDSSMSVEQVLEAYDQAWADRSARYWASAEGQQALKEQEEIRLHHQSRHDALMAELWDVAGDESKLMDWLSDFSDAADHVGVEGKDFQRVSSVLELHGYVDNDCVGWDKSQFEDPRVMARYIAGQALNCMKQMNMGPHPVTQNFVEKYHALTKTH